MMFIFMQIVCHSITNETEKIRKQMESIAIKIIDSSVYFYDQ